MRKRSSSVGAMVGIAVLIGSLISNVKPSVSKPGDVLNSLSSPGVGAPAEEKRDIGTGDLSYASRTGALQYGYNFIVAPGRLGVEPGIGLSYSSQGSLRGGIASGWSMGIPMIELDTSDNRILEMSSRTGPAGLAALENEDLSFLSTMSGGHRLVLERETVAQGTESVEAGWKGYRSEYDDSYIRYERHIAKGIWRARTMDGKTWYFGTGHDGEDDTIDSDTASSDPGLHDGVPTSLIFDSSDTAQARVSPHHQPLTRVVDKFGNTIRYFWEADFPTNAEQTRFPESIRLHSIRYTENVTANQGSHAKVEFLYREEAFCSSRVLSGELPIGASLDHRGFFPWYSGRKALSVVETSARNSNNGSFSAVRRVKIDTKDECPVNIGGSQRQLTSITLVDPDVPDVESAPELQNPITFGYGSTERSFDAVKEFSLSPSGIPSSNIEHALAWGERSRWDMDATLERSLLDLDGDGRLDLLQTAPGDDCEFTWRRNQGNGNFGPPNTLAFPDEGMLWRNEATPSIYEGCSLSARRTTWANIDGVGEKQSVGNHVLHRFIDMNRDGRPDLVTSIQYTACLIMHDIDDLTVLPPEELTGITAPGISSVFQEPWDTEITPFGACSNISPISVDSTVGNVCDENSSAPHCSCAVVDQLAADILEDRGGPVDCADFSEDISGFNNNRTAEGGAKWNGESQSCKSYPLMRNGHYPWMIHYSNDDENTGELGFGPGNRIWSPIPLDPATNESGLANNGGKGLSSSNHAVLDVTGDGIIDVITVGTLVTATTVNGESGRHWNVFAGQVDPENGEFLRFTDVPYLWIIPEGGLISASAGSLYSAEAPVYANSLTSTSSMLLDTNADGLPDLVRRKADESGFEIALNTGRGFCVSQEGEVAGTVLAGEMSVDRTGYDNVGTLDTSPPGSSNTPHWIAKSGEGKNFAKLVDVDGDGLPDYYDAGDGNVKLSPFGGCEFEEECTSLRMGAGAGFLDRFTPMTYYIPRDIEVDGWEEGSDYWWQKSDFMDLDGDGLNDIATEKSGNIHTWDLRSEDTAPGKPLRLLNLIDNGQGLKTEVEYHPYNDDKAMSHRATGKGMPNHVWVATKITRESTIAESYSPAPKSEVTIRYGEPAYTKSHRGQHGFRGFESLQTSRAHKPDATSGFSVSEQRYNYDIDWSGRLSDTVTYVDGFPSSDSSLIAGISSQEWTEYSLYAGVTKSFHSVASATKNCLKDDGGFYIEEQCGVNQISGQQVSEMQAIADDGGESVAWVAVSTEAFLVNQSEEGSKRSESDLQVFSEPTKFMLHTPEKRRFVREAGQWVLAAKTTRRLDSTNTYTQYPGQYGVVDGALIHWESKSTRNSVGLVKESQDAEDFGSQLKTTTGYTGLDVYASSVTNELGHTTRITTDYGTGQVTRALGANLLPCHSHKYEGVETHYDKLGRPTSVMQRSCIDGVYGLTEKSYFEYELYDSGSGKPAHIIASTILDTVTRVSAVTTTYVDGAGRTLRIENTVGSGSADVAQTRFRYDWSGQLVRHEETNPSTDPNSAAEFTVATYSYDSLGRATEMRHGANADIGVNVSYRYNAGETRKITTEIVSVSDGGPAGETTQYTDYLGRMVQLDEKMDNGLNAKPVATTLYEYDGNDNVASITDSANVVTEMIHDMAGRRTKVIRDEREWSYAYDKNGNMVRETSPNDLGESADNPVAGLYTTSTVYDALDRPTSRLLATNGLSTSEAGTYDAGFVTFEYDSCANGLGRRCLVSSGKLHHTEYVFDWAGRVIEERQDIGVRKSLTGTGDLKISRSSHFGYDGAGKMIESWLPDGPDKSSSTHLHYEYNEFTGAPEKLSHYMGVDKKGNPAIHEIAFVTRNRAQRVISQTTGCLTRDWAYDILGRVTNTEVQGVGCSAQNGPILSEGMQYFDSSEVKKHDVYRTGLPAHSFDYNYDSQHQLINADDSLSYQVAFNYSPDGNGTMQSVTGGGGVLLGRDPMDYSYGDGTILGADKHAPTTLSGLAKDLLYSYDFAGNVNKRTEVSDPTGSPSQDEWSFVYDGVSQQREVQLNNGTGGRELYYYTTAGQRYMAVTYTNGTDTIPERIRVWMGGAELWYRPNSNLDAIEIDTEYAYLSLGGINIGRIKSQGPVLSTEATFANGLSHVMGSVNWDSGVVNAAYVYGPYGEIVDSVGQEQDDHLRRFNGKESDQLSKLSYYGFRYYDSQSLSWTQADPLYLFVPDIGMDEPRRMSLYSFSLNNPMRYVDPDGRDAKQSKTLPLFSSNKRKRRRSRSADDEDEDEDEDEEDETDDRKGESADEDGEDKDKISDAGGKPSGETDQVVVALFEGLTGWGLIPAITIKVTAKQAKQIEGAGILAFALSGGIGVLKRGAEKAVRGIVRRWANKSRKAKKKYAPRVRARGVEDPKSHNFPYSFDDDILATTPIPKRNGYNMFQKAGTMNDKEGVFEMGVRSDGVIDHRFFRPNQKKK